MRKLFLMFAASGVLFSGTLHAQKQWNKAAHMPDGGNIADLATDNAGTIYALTSLHTNIFYSTDNGLNWMLIPNTSDLWNASSIEVDKTTGTLYISSLWFGIKWTTDKGLNWNGETFHSIPGGFYANITQVGCKPGTSTVVAAEFVDAFTPANIFMSTNSGASWTTVIGVPWNSAQALKFLADGTLLAAVNDGVFRSPDNGITWSASNTGIAGKVAFSLAEKRSNGHLFTAIGFDEAMTDTIHCGVYRSTDNGHTWTMASAGLPEHNVTCVEIDSANNKLYAVTPNTVYESADEGASWIPASSGIANTHLSNIVTTHSGLYLATSNLGVQYATTPATTGWSARNKGLKEFTLGNITTGYTNNEIHSIDLQNMGSYELNGINWTQQNNGFSWYEGNRFLQFWGQEIVNDHNDVLYAIKSRQRNNGVYRSIDHGATWTNISAGIPGLAASPFIFYTARVDYLNNLYLIADNESDLTSAVFRSTDHGATWSTFLPPIPLGASQYLDLDFGHTAIYLTALGTDTMGTTSVSISVSHDNGATFDNVPFNLGSLYGGNLTVAPNDSLYIQITGHIYKRNGTNNWFQLPDAAWNHDYNNYPLDLYIDKENHLFASSAKTGVFYCDNDSTWTDISEGLPHFSYPYEPAPVLLTPIDIKFTMDNTPYAMCSFRYADNLQGLYKFSVGTTGFASHGTGTQALTVYPNPCADVVTVNLNVPDAGPALLQVYDLNGQVVRTETMTNKSVSINTASLIPGMYYIRVTSNRKTLQASFVKE